MAKVDLMSQWTKTNDELKNETLSLSLEELSNNADAFVSAKKNAWNRAKTTLKSVQMSANKTADFGAIVDAEIRTEIAKAEYDNAVKISEKYFGVSED